MIFSSVSGSRDADEELCAHLEGGREGRIKVGRGKVAVGVACCERSEHSH